MLGISDQSEEHGGQSAVFTLPAQGGTPRRITPLTPSYLHGWSPDGQFLVYTGGRSNKFDIYKIPSDGSGPEIRLTDAPGLNDGPEYTPDGKYIYFNSSRTGKMQIWRMKPDGTIRNKSRTTYITTGFRIFRRTENGSSSSAFRKTSIQRTILTTNNVISACCPSKAASQG